ncbi:MAG: imidazole glycerol phosphate synthase subunit HisH [Hydrogenoanaerobacterium sp.]
MIAVVDYGVGNLFSLQSSLNYLGLKSTVTNNAKEIMSAERVILPGVGAFANAMQKLHETGLDDVVKAYACTGSPLMGICLGMQVLFERGLEYGIHDGLGLLKGEVAPFADEIVSSGLKVPHMGWNKLTVVKPCPLLKYTNDGDYVYFVHSYHARGCEASLAATSSYGTVITAAVCKENVMGTQFHPEKSGEAGLKILKAFSEI